MRNRGETIRSVLGWLLILCCAIRVQAQERVEVGAFDPACSNCILLSTGVSATETNNKTTPEPSFFGLRVLVYRQGETLEVAPPSERIALFGPNAADGTYARLHWEPAFERKLVTLQWARSGPHTVIGRFSTQGKVRLALESYQPFGGGPGANAPGVRRVNFRAQDTRTLLGEQVLQQASQGKSLRWLLRADRAGDGAASYNDAPAFYAALVKEGRAVSSGAESGGSYGLQRFAALSFELNENESIGFVLALGDDLAALEAEATQALAIPVTKTLEQAETRYETTRPRSAGWLSDALESLSRTVNWNRIYVPQLRSEFSSSWRTAAPGNAVQQFNLHWDAFFRALTVLLIDPAQATATVRTLLTQQGNDGRLSPATLNLSPATQENLVLSGRSMPPVGALVAWKIYLATHDVTFLTSVYPRLKHWHEWWLADRGDGRAWRDGNGDGLLEWGYDAELEIGEIGARQMPLLLKQQAAAAESGWADSPQWQLEARPPAAPVAEPAATTGEAAAPPEIPAPLFNEKAHTLELTPIGLNALYALEAEVLFLMARELGLKEEQAKWEAQYALFKQLINERLWSETDKLYLNRHWNGAFSQRLTPDVFFVLVAGLAPPERAGLLLEALRDPKRFGAGPLPTLARADAEFTQNGNWRGRSAALANYLTYLGLKRYGFYLDAATLARQSTQLVRESWLSEARVYDSFPSVVQEPSAIITPPATHMETWFGGLFWLCGIEELIALNPWAGLTIGNEAVSDAARLHNLVIGSAVYDIAIGPQSFSVKRNGQLEVEADAPLRLFNYQGNEATFGFFSETSKPQELRIPAVPNREVSGTLDGKLLGPFLPGKPAKFKLPTGLHRIVIVK